MSKPVQDAYIVAATRTPVGKVRGALKNVLVGVCEEVEGGASLSEAMAKFPKAFDKLYTKMVAAGEVGGDGRRSVSGGVQGHGAASAKPPDCAEARQFCARESTRLGRALRRR